QMQNMFAAQGDNPVNWQMAEDIARRAAAGQEGIPGAPEPSGTPGDPSPSDEAAAELRQAAQVARLWLDPVLAIDVPSTDLAVYSRGAWLHRTLPRWKPIVEPVAKYMAGAIGEAISAQLGQMGELGDMPIPGGDPAAMMERVGGTMFGVQFGHALGPLARAAAGPRRGAGAGRRERRGSDLRPFAGSGRGPHLPRGPRDRAHRPVRLRAVAGQGAVLRDRGLLPRDHPGSRRPRRDGARAGP